MQCFHFMVFKTVMGFCKLQKQMGMFLTAFHFLQTGKAGGNVLNCAIQPLSAISSSTLVQHPQVHQHLLAGNLILLLELECPFVPRWRNHIPYNDSPKPFGTDLSITPERIVRWRPFKSVQHLISKENLLKQKHKRLSWKFWRKWLKTIRPRFWLDRVGFVHNSWTDRPMEKR